MEWLSDMAPLMTRAQLEKLQARMRGAEEREADQAPITEVRYSTSTVTPSEWARVALGLGDPQAQGLARAALQSGLGWTEAPTTLPEMWARRAAGWPLGQAHPPARVSGNEWDGRLMIQSQDQAKRIAELEADLATSRARAAQLGAHIQRWQAENASLRAAYADLEARHALPPAAPQPDPLPARALRFSV